MTKVIMQPLFKYCRKSVPVLLNMHGYAMRWASVIIIPAI